MRHIKPYGMHESISQNNSQWPRYVIEDALELWKSELPKKPGMIGPLFHGCTEDFDGFDDDFERSEFVYDFDLPDGLVFLTSDPAEARLYPAFEGPRKVVPMYIPKKNGVLTFRLDTDAPSQAFDDDMQGLGGLGMYSEFVNGDHDKWVLEVRGRRKSTFVTYPDIPVYDLQDALRWDMPPNAKGVFKYAEINPYIKRVLEENGIKE